MLSAGATYRRSVEIIGTNRVTICQIDAGDNTSQPMARYSRLCVAPWLFSGSLKNGAVFKYFLSYVFFPQDFFFPPIEKPKGMFIQCEFRAESTSNSTVALSCAHTQT